ARPDRAGRTIVRGAARAATTVVPVLGHGTRHRKELSRSASRLLSLLLDLGGLTTQVTQVVELGTADGAPGHHLAPVNDRAVHREGALDPDPEAHLADGEGLPDTGAVAPDHHAL